MDAVALASVIASGSVGFAGLVIAARSAERRLRFEVQQHVEQRAHERSLAHDERIRDDRVRLYVDLLVEATRSVRELRYLYKVGGPLGPQKETHTRPDELEFDVLASRLLAFASDTVKDEWQGFTTAMRVFRQDPAATLALLPDTVDQTEILGMLGQPVESHEEFDVRGRLEERFMAVSIAYHTMSEAIRNELTRGAG